MKKSILIIDELHPIFKIEAERLGYQVDDKPKINRAETLSILHQYTGLAVRTKFQIDEEILNAAPNLRFIARAGAGLDNIDVQAASAKGIQLLAANEGNKDAVGEHTIGLLLGLLNNLRKSDIEVRNGVWDREGNRGYELKGKTVGIIGYGHMGQSLAKKLSGFEVQVLAYDKYKTGFSDAYAREVSMEEIVKQVDVLSLHIPLTRETKGMVNEEYLFHFRKPIFFLNTARGEIVETQAILNGIRTGKIIGAGLDVLETEKFPNLQQQAWFEELKNSGKILLSPHIAGWTYESYQRISEVLVQKLSQLKL